MSFHQAPDRRQLRQFGLTIGASVVSMFGLVLPWALGSPLPLWPWVVAVPFLISALALPFVLRPIFVAWMRVGHLANWLVSRAALVLVYYALVVPTGLVMRLFRRNILGRIDSRVTSYRTVAERRSRKHLEKPF